VKAIVNTAPGVLEMQEVPAPEPQRGQVRIRTLSCGICATDLKIMTGTDRGGFPRIMGHEWSGVVDEIGPAVDTSLRGCPCVAENVLADGGEVGFEHAGGYAEGFITEAANVHGLPADFPHSSAALIEPLAVCVRGMRRLALEDPSCAAVLGDGPIGLLMIPLLKRAGVERVVVLGGRAARLAVATELGACHTVNYHDVTGDLASAVTEAAGREPTIVIEASGSAAAIDAGVRVAGSGGRFLVIGDYDDARAGFAWQRVLHRELVIIGSNASAGAWPEAVALAAANEVPLSRLITTTFPATEFGRAIDLVRQAREQIKVVMEWR
jgi:threonine dehydrogenase-like Zn-dependent dehydrogenase